MDRYIDGEERNTRVDRKETYLLRDALGRREPSAMNHHGQKVLIYVKHRWFRHKD